MPKKGWKRYDIPQYTVLLTRVTVPRFRDSGRSRSAPPAQRSCSGKRPCSASAHCLMSHYTTLLPRAEEASLAPAAPLPLAPHGAGNEASTSFQGADRLGGSVIKPSTVPGPKSQTARRQNQVPSVGRGHGPARACSTCAHQKRRW